MQITMQDVLMALLIISFGGWAAIVKSSASEIIQDLKEIRIELKDINKRLLLLETRHQIEADIE